MTTETLSLPISTSASPDAASALRAVRRLARSPEQALPDLRQHLGRLLSDDRDRLARLLADLDAPSFAKREAASAELKTFLQPPLRGDELGRLADFRVLGLIGQGEPLGACAKAADNGGLREETCKEAADNDGKNCRKQRQ